MVVDAVRGAAGCPALDGADRPLPPSGSAEQEGYVWRGSDVVDGMVNQRYGKLFGDAFASYRKERDSQPSRLWPLAAGCEASGVQRRELQFRKRGYNNVVAWMSGKFERATAYAFTVSWPKDKMVAGTTLMLAFDNEREAYEWRVAFENVISRLGPGMTPRKTLPYSIRGQRILEHGGLVQGSNSSSSDASMHLENTL